MEPRPKPPRSLGKDGARLWRELHEDLPESKEFDSREQALVLAACRQTDVVARIEADLAKAPLVVPSATPGVVKPNPLLAMLSTHRSLELRALAQIELSAPEAGPSVRSVRAQRAANKRYRAKRAIAEERLHVA